MTSATQTHKVTRPARRGGGSHDGADGTLSLSDPQTGLEHHRQHGLAEEFKIGCKVEERDLDPVAAGPLEPHQLVDDLLGAADDLDIAAEGAMRVTMRLPGNRIARSADARRSLRSRRDPPLR